MIKKTTHGILAFTLVELAIVIVIIGLLVGGVLQGQELINQAKIRAQIKQFQTYDAATLTFRAKTGFLPGDIPHSVATKFGVTACSNFGYEGNGRLDYFLGTIPAPTAWCEAAFFFGHLKQLKLIQDNLFHIVTSFSVGDRYPENKFGTGGIAPVQPADGILYYFMGPTRRNDLSNISMYSYSSQFPSETPAQASALDTKLDDGISNTGGIKAVTATAVDNDTTLNNCVGATLGTYNFAKPDEVLCRIVVKSMAQ